MGEAGEGAWSRQVQEVLVRSGFIEFGVRVLVPSSVQGFFAQEKEPETPDPKPLSLVAGFHVQSRCRGRVT